MSIYPPKITERCGSPNSAGRCADENATGKDASFVCGCFVAFSLKIDGSSKVVSNAAFRTSGCGYMIAAGDVLCDIVSGKHLADLNGLDTLELSGAVTERLGQFPDGRGHCAECCIDALHKAFADHRRRVADEFNGDKALICTCFGIDEETIEHFISARSAASLIDVMAVTKAGTGCGSCRMLIEEMLDIS